MKQVYQQLAHYRQTGQVSRGIFLPEIIAPPHLKSVLPRNIRKDSLGECFVGKYETMDNTYVIKKGAEIPIYS